MRLRYCLLLTIPLFTVLTACEKEEIVPANPPTEEPTPPPIADAFHYERVEGFVQKGPFLNGTAMQVAELQTNLAQTGRNYNTQLIDNRGTFELYDVDFATPYVQLKADGFYYNEVSDETSVARLTLYAVTDLNEHNALNVNLLTTLERARVEYLVSRGSKFWLAKQQAQREIFDIFEMGDGDNAKSELLDITRAGEDNAKLLAMSVILQGALTVGELSELVANISTDIREDGVLDSEILGSQLVNSAFFLHPATIRENLERRYASMGQAITVPDFEPYLQRFLDSTDFVFTANITYPKTGSFGVNLLGPDITDGTIIRGPYSFAATLPRSATLRVEVSGANWSISPSDQLNRGWTYTSLEYGSKARTFTSTATGEIDFHFYMMTHDNLRDEYIIEHCTPPPGGVCEDKKIPNPNYVPYPTTKIEVYENQDTVPVLTKVFSVRT